jgi:hypothetical protein
VKYRHSPLSLRVVIVVPSGAFRRHKSRADPVDAVVGSETPDEPAQATRKHALESTATNLMAEFPPELPISRPYYRCL